MTHFFRKNQRFSEHLLTWFTIEWRDIFLYFVKTLSYKWEKGIGKKICKNGGRCYLWGPQAKNSRFHERGYQPYLRLKTQNYQTSLIKPEIIPKKGRKFKSYKKSSDDTKKWSPTAKNWPILAKFEQRSPAKTVFTYRISFYFAKRR